MIVVGEKVDIDRARAPALLLGTVAPERALDRLRARQAAHAARGPVSTAMQRLTKGGWSSTPQGGVR